MFAQVLKVTSNTSSRKNDPLMLCEYNPEVWYVINQSVSLSIMLIFFLVDEKQACIWGFHFRLICVLCSENNDI